jgi:hypothetical protein
MAWNEFYLAERVGRYSAALRALMRKAFDAGALYGRKYSKVPEKPKKQKEVKHR